MDEVRNTPASAINGDGAEEQEEPASSAPAGEPEAPLAPASPQPDTEHEP